MTLFLSNIGLALIWAILTGRFNPANIAVGFFLGYLALRMVRRILGPSQYFSTLPRSFHSAARPRTRPARHHTPPQELRTPPSLRTPPRSPPT